MFFFVLFLAAFLRLIGLNWDAGFHLHPDERMIIMTSGGLHLPKNWPEWQTVFTPASPLNPHFFAYGSFPIYLLKITGFLLGKDSYDGMLYVGRILSALFDLGTVILVFLIGKTILRNNPINTNNPILPINVKMKKNPKNNFLFLKYFAFIGLLDDWVIGLLAMFFYALSVLPIQSSHFYISDIPLTFLVTLTLYLSLKLLSSRNPHILAVFLGISFGLALATKLTAAILIVPVFTALLLNKISATKKPRLAGLFAGTPPGEESSNPSSGGSILQVSQFVKIIKKVPKILRDFLSVGKGLCPLPTDTRRFFISRIKDFVKSLHPNPFGSHRVSIGSATSAVHSPLSFILGISISFVNPFLFFIFCFLTFILTMPYAFIDFPTFRAQILEQTRMQTNPFAFPFTLQYVNTAPYLYFLENLVKWGLGWPQGLLAVSGTFYGLIYWLKWLLKDRLTYPGKELTVLFSFFIVYFIVIGHSAVKFMRYFLPLYPLLAIFAAWFVFQVLESIKKASIARSFLSVGKRVHPFPTDTCGLFISHIILFVNSFFLFAFLFLILLWPLSFMTIYSRPHTRIAASKWIYENVPDGATLAVEHWDDQLPLRLSDKFSKSFKMAELPLYEGDTPAKWQAINEKLAKTDYLIIASNRLYVPLIRLGNCQAVPVSHCYPLTASYYQRLFSGQLGFTKVAEFTSYPQIKDDSADESFTVYDHPKVMVFKKI